MYLLTVLASFLVSQAFAYEPPTRPPFQFDNIAPERGNGRDYDLELGLRARRVSVPTSFLKARFFDADAENWAYIEDRPRITGNVVGLEIVVRGSQDNGLFYLEYIDSTMSDGYWDSVEEPANHLNGEYLDPTDGFGVVGIGADYAYELHLVDADSTRGAFGLSFLVGGGLGVGVITGRIDRWVADREGNPAYKRFLDGEAADDEAMIPPVLPLVDANCGLRLSLGERASLRLEGGLHTLLFYGGSLGVSF